MPHSPPIFPSLAATWCLCPAAIRQVFHARLKVRASEKKLKELVADLEIPEGIGYIMRTEAVGRTPVELAKDLQYLMKLYNGIREKGAELKGAGLIYQESDLVIRTIRDYFNAEIDEVLVDSKDVYKQARAFFKETMPKYENLVKMHLEKRPIFSRYQLEEQIDLIYEKKVPLKSGGSIFMEPTEALVSIDVNSGKSTGEKGVEDTAFKTNMEAAAEAARQLRLRDLGGLIVIDFIDMRDRKHNNEVEKALKTALKGDKARVTVGKISQFGLLEMSRQRIKQTISQASTLECPHCEGRGKVKSVEAMALSFMRKIHAAAAKGTVAEVRGGLPLEVAYYLLNRKKRELSQIETDYDIEVTIKGKPSFLLNEMEVDLVKRERPFMEEIAPEVPVAAVSGIPALAAAVAEPVPGEEVTPKRKRRRGKKKHHLEGEITPPPEPFVTGEAVAGEPSTDAVEAEIATGATAAETTATEGTEEHKKKRRRKRRRGGKGAAAEHGAEGIVEAEVAAAEPAAAPVAEQVAGEGENTEEMKKKRRRKRRRGAKPAPVEAVVGEAPEAPVPVASAETNLPEAQPEQLPQGKPKKPRAPRKRQVEQEVVQEQPAATTPAEAPEVVPAKPKRAARPRKAPAVTAEAPQPEAPAEPQEKQKPKRAPRKKKETVPAE